MVRKIFYLGPSMNPLLQRGDTLLVAPYSSQEVQPGDVVVFQDPHRGQVVHRVVAVTAEGLITKGDNNPTVDDRLVAPQDILGRVTGLERQGRTLPVPRKAPATLYLLKVRHWLDRVFSRLLQPVYDRLAQSGVCRRLLCSLIKPRLVFVPRPEGPEGQLWLGNFLIGRKMSHHSQWSIRRPFGLWVDEAGLPDRAFESPKNKPFQS
jgi:signal peptidase I